jgi:hypothetical protein
MNCITLRRAVLLLPLLAAGITIVPSVGRSGPNLAPSANANANPRVLPPDSNPYGKSYSEWAASFWQWAFSLPLDGHPFLDDPDFNFAANQSGPVWYWSSPDGTFTRAATLPAGKALFLTIRDVDSSSLEDPPFFGATEDEQREISHFFAEHIVDVFCTIDGVPVENLEDYRFSTDQFEFTAPTPWIFGNVGGDGTAVGEGYFLMLAPMPVGHHTIHYGGTFHFEAGELDVVPVDFPKDVTIELDVR